MVPNTGQYLYDANANMTYDPSKKISVSYNPLNLPSLVEFDNSDFIEYTYTATGTKLRKTVTSWKTTTGGTTDYAGQFLYQDNELSCIFTPVGRIVPMQYNDETFWKHEYNLKDHLGNTRIVFAAHPHGQPEVMQQTSYYPFGMTLQQQNFGGALNQPNKLLYNGKELQDDELAGVSLDWYDYGARFYDAALGRWHAVDPMADDFPSWTPYHYVHNNPIVLIDPTGMSATKYEDEEGNLLLETNDGSDDVVKVSDDKVDQYKKHAELYEIEGMAEVYDSQGWNDNAKMDLLGLESTDELNSLDYVSSQFARQKLIDYFQDDRSVSSWAVFLMAEVASQNANPLNHIPAPINIKGPKLKLRSNSNLKPKVAPSTPKKVNPWHKFRSEMGKGTFTKEKYGSTEAAKKAKNEAYKKWKEENGY